MVLSKDSLWDSGHDETVEVNQRALIDKVLARYSGEFTVFRELLQNSDDAQSKAVEIRFESQTFLDGSKGETNGSFALERHLPDLRTTPVHQWTFKNNGMVFRDEDWSRLKKIAEGNPDEEKIGAFGVGFYSLFSVTEEPFVSSGDQWMGFYWKDKKDQLFARRGQLPEAGEDAASRLWTTFSMTLREPSPIPVAFDFTRFLASSLTFMRYLSEVTVYFDDKRLVKLNKASGLPRDLGIPNGLNKRTPSGMMTVSNIQSAPLLIQAEVMKWVHSSGTEKKRPTAPRVVKSGPPSGGFFSSLFSSLSSSTATPRIATPSLPVEVVNPLAINHTSVSLSIFSANVEVHLDKKTSAEINRSTKKNPPAKMKFELIYTAKDEYDASVEEDAKLGDATGSIFQGLRADLDNTGAGKVFIGHSTGQTTGLGGHVAARFIPTVERESIDFMDRHVAIWNKELLAVGGFLARAAYEFELSSIRSQWEASSNATTPPSAEIQAHLIGRVVHALKFFSFHQSTPSHQVSSLMQSAFFSCSQTGNFPMMSTKGVRNSKDVRLPNPVFAAFLKDLPVLPDSVLTGVPLMVSHLKEQKMIVDIQFQDVLQELNARPLPLDECVACLTWWISVFQDPREREQLLPIRAQLLNALVFTTGAADSKDQKIIALNTIKYFFNPKSSTAGLVPMDGPLPDNLLPTAVSKSLKPESISISFPWAEFSLLHWVSHICRTDSGSIPAEFSIAMSPVWAERVIGIISRGWNQLPMDAKASIVAILRTKTCIPTSNGMKLPQDAYFPNVNIFGDLPVVTFASNLPIKGNVEKVLQGLGVRKHVELQIIFNRMVKTNEWTIADLTKYLVSVKSTLTEDELVRLKATAAFPTEIKEGETHAKRPRYRADQLFEPLEVLRSLGLPVIEWGGHTKWRGTSEEAKFLFELGLQRYPPLSKLIELCSGEDQKIRDAAFQYLIDNIGTRYTTYDPMDFKDVKFIPALKGSDPCLANMREVYSSADWTSLGFLVLQAKYTPFASKLKIRENPPAAQLVAILQSKPPKDEAQATQWFSLLAARVNDFRNTDLQHLSTLSFVPIKAEKGSVGPTMRWLPPSQCYLGSDKQETFHSKLFTFVNFGASANAFLTACGTRNQPSVEEVAKILLGNPRHFYELAGGPESFLAELRNLAVNARNIAAPTILRMKKMPILLGILRKPRNQTKASDEWDDDEWDISYELKRPYDIVVVDDSNTYQAFGADLFAAPQEDILEVFYAHLGSPRLTRIVKEEYQTSSEIHNSKVAQETRSLILERLPLFLHEQTQTATRISYSWLSSGNNFVVKAFGKVSVVKHLRFGDIHSSRKQDASAVSRRAAGSIELWLAANAQIDMYEVATSLIRMLFDSPKANDILLLMTILSTDLRSLKRRGYNVDRILRQQKEAHRALIAEEERLREERKNQLQLARPPPTDHEKASLASKESSATDQTLVPPDSRPSPSAFGNTLQSLKRKLAGKAPAADATPVAPSPPIPHASKPLPPQPERLPSNEFKMNDDYLSSAGQSPRPQQHILDEPIPSETEDMPGGFTPRGNKPTESGPTPLGNISKNIELAINACKPESGDLLENRERMQRVKESVEDGYCDISGRKENLHNIAQMGSVRIYLSDEIPRSEADNFMESKRTSIARFIHIMTSLATIYQLPLTSLHIFYDLEGGLIAFNRNGSIFLNLRYFEQWHDASVRQGNLQTAYISWYFSIAHELAHNLVHPHNSEHEFYFSAICEHYMMGLTQLLRSRVSSG